MENMEINPERLEKITERVKEKVGQNELAAFVDLMMGRDYAETILAILVEYPELVEKVNGLKKRLYEEQEKIHSLNKEVEVLKKSLVQYDDAKKNV